MKRQPNKNKVCQRQEKRVCRNQQGRNNLGEPRSNINVIRAKVFPIHALDIKQDATEELNKHRNDQYDAGESSNAYNRGELQNPTVPEQRSSNHNHNNETDAGVLNNASGQGERQDPTSPVLPHPEIPADAGETGLSEYQIRRVLEFAGGWPQATWDNITCTNLAIAFGISSSQIYSILIKEREKRNEAVWREIEVYRQKGLNADFLAWQLILGPYVPQTAAFGWPGGHITNQQQFPAAQGTQNSLAIPSLNHPAPNQFPPNISFDRTAHPFPLVELMNNLQNIPFTGPRPGPFPTIVPAPFPPLASALQQFSVGNPLTNGLPVLPTTTIPQNNPIVSPPCPVTTTTPALNHLHPQFVPWIVPNPVVHALNQNPLLPFSPVANNIFRNFVAHPTLPPQFLMPHNEGQGSQRVHDVQVNAETVLRTRNFAAPREPNRQEN